MTPVELSSTVLRAVRRAVDDGELAVSVPERAQVVPPGPGGRGDYATNVALQLARPAGRPPREVAEILRPHLGGVAGVARVDITGPGFLNITLSGREPALVAEILRRRERYGYAEGPTSQVVQLHHPREVRAAVTAQVLARILRSQGAVVRVSCEIPGEIPGEIHGEIHGEISPEISCEAAPDPAAPDPAGSEPAWAGFLGVTVDAPGASSTHGAPGTPNTPSPPDAFPPPPPPPPLNITLRPVPAAQDPTPLGRDAARWALLHPAPHDRPRITDEHLVQAEGNPLFRVRYAYARCQALGRNAAALGFSAALGDSGDCEDCGHSGHSGDRTSGVSPLLDALDTYPHALAAAARHRAPDRLARHLVTVADALLAFQHTVLPLGDEKPSAAHRSRLALAEAAGTVLAGGLSLLGIDAPTHL
ncbi:DALR anticodon-binding domain-containing protein [Streptomyces sp. LRE541]|uniref:ArgS-related anticodon-binding protein NrtL n=1 Tax=Streptomyces sp. LRE541 TaxID=2931983 RepID=UPI00200BDB86|nr:DALR anticodon-binding domain-containing protein [Streptomyces sp. LRE541]UPZ28942.1 DALR anticodon-binding domain-containing protein [Streptomyces sp. LRE541]